MQQIYLNIIPNGICPRVYVNQYDVGRGIQIKFKDGSANYGFASGTTFKVNGRKSDGHVFEYTEADKWDATNYIILKSMPPGGATTVYLYTTEQMTAASGEVLMQLTYKLDNAVQGTLNFIMIVQERPEATGDPSESDVPGVVRLVNRVAPDADGEVILKWKDQSSVSNLSITENTRTMSTTRNAGTYVYVKTDDQLYVITSTISSGGTLTPGTNATATSVGAALATLTSQLTSVAGTITNSQGAARWFSSSLTKKNNVCYFDIAAELSAPASNSAIQIAEFPANFRPSAKKYYPCVIADGSDANAVPALIDITTAGICKVHTPAASLTGLVYAYVSGAFVIS